MKKNYMMFALDDSPSMSRYRDEALKTFNESIDAVKAGQAAFPDQSTSVGVSLFSGTVRVLRRMQEVAGVRCIEEGEYNTNSGSGTALLDAVESAVGQLSLEDPGPDASFLIVVVTDGEENASRFTNAKSLQKLIAGKQVLENWSFAFMVPQASGSRYKVSLCRLLSIPEGNVTEWETSAKGIERASKTLSDATMGYMSSRSSGEKKTVTYFANMGHLTTHDLNKHLIDVTQKVRVMQPVGDEDGKQIRDFYAERFPGQVYEPGKLYYQLLKSEKVQPQKRLLIRDKDGKFFSGDYARSIIGLPFVECRLRPGAQNGYEVYVESTSYNRKVKRGMKMIALGL